MLVLLRGLRVPTGRAPNPPGRLVVLRVLLRGVVSSALRESVVRELLLYALVVFRGLRDPTGRVPVISSLCWLDLGFEKSVLLVDSLISVLF